MQHSSSSISSLGPIEHASPNLGLLLGLAAVDSPTDELIDEVAYGTTLVPLNLLELLATKLPLHGRTIPEQSVHDDAAQLARRCTVGVCLLGSF